MFKLVLKQKKSQTNIHPKVNCKYLFLPKIKTSSRKTNHKKTLTMHTSMTFHRSMDRKLKRSSTRNTRNRFRMKTGEHILCYTTVGLVIKFPDFYEVLWQPLVTIFFPDSIFPITSPETIHSQYYPITVSIL